MAKTTRIYAVRCELRVRASSPREALDYAGQCIEHLEQDWEQGEDAPLMLTSGDVDRDHAPRIIPDTQEPR